MTVIEKNRLINYYWELGCCENCRGNPKKVRMEKEFLVSGDPDKKYRSDREFWVCPKCGFTKEL